jgi:hypothetical protein
VGWLRPAHLRLAHSCPSVRLLFAGSLLAVCWQATQKGRLGEARTGNQRSRPQLTRRHDNLRTHSSRHDRFLRAHWVRMPCAASERKRAANCCCADAFPTTKVHTQKLWRKSSASNMYADACNARRNRGNFQQVTRTILDKIDTTEDAKHCYRCALYACYRSCACIARLRLGWHRFWWGAVSHTPRMWLLKDASVG